MPILILLHEIDAYAELDSNQCLSPKEFTFANSPRYTFIGHPPFRENNFQLIPAICFGGIITGIFAAQHIAQMNTIWKEQAEFKFLEDGNYALYVDKFGHFLGAYTSSVLFSEGMYAAGFDKDWSRIGGGTLGLAFQTYIEIMDGYGEQWGFSWSDWYANAIGSSFYIAQEYVPFLQNFTPKFMYFPADWHGELVRDHAEAFIDDYSSHTFWLSVNVHNLLPESAQPYWPEWLELSFGYAVRNLCDGYVGSQYVGCDLEKSPLVVDKVHGRRKIMVALDYNLIKLLPDGPHYWNWFRQSLNYVKFPSPAIEFDLEDGDTRFMLVYPFSLW